MKCVCVEVSFEKFGSHTSFFIFIKSSRICISPKLMINLLLFSHSVTSNSLQPHELHHARLPCPSLSPGVCSNSCPMSRWWYLILWRPLLHLPSVLLSSRVFSSELDVHIRCQSMEASASVLLMNIRGWFSLRMTGLILVSKELSRVFSSTTVWKYQFFGAQPSLWSSSHICTWLLEKT